MQASCESLRQLNFEASLGASFFSMIEKKIPFPRMEKKRVEWKVKVATTTFFNC